MAMGVVDRFEIIDIHDHESERLAVFLGIGDQIAQMPAHVTAIVQAGKLVGDCHFETELDIVAQPVSIAFLAQLGTHPRHQFVPVYRPGQIIIDAHFQGLCQLAAVAIRHHHQDWHIAAFRERSKLRAKTQAIEAAHAETDNNQIGISTPHPHQRFLERIHRGHFVLRRQGGGQPCHGLKPVLDHQDTAHGIGIQKIFGRIEQAHALSRGLAHAQFIGHQLEPHQRTHPREQGRIVNRLGEKIVGPRFQARNTIGRLVERRHHHHRNMRDPGVGFDAPAERCRAHSRPSGPGIRAR